MSRTKSLLLAAIPVVLALIIAWSVITRGIIGIQPFSDGYPGDLADDSQHEAIERYKAEGVERAWRNGSIRFEGGSGHSEDDPLTVRMDFPHRMHQFDLDQIIPVYLREHVPDSTFSQVSYDWTTKSFRPRYAQYVDADGVRRTLWLDPHYGVDWAHWIRRLVLGAGFLAGYFVYGSCRRRADRSSVKT